MNLQALNSPQLGNGQSLNGNFGMAVTATKKPASAIASAEDTLRSARELAARVEHIIGRLCGGADGEASCFDDSPDISVLGRLHRCTIETDSAITRANAALDRLDVELN